jgi:hypothetical protein
VQWTSDQWTSDDPNEMWNKFIIFLNTEIKNNTHKKYTTFNSLKPWINDDLLQLIKHKRRLWNKFKKITRTAGLRHTPTLFQYRFGEST